MLGSRCELLRLFERVAVAALLFAAVVATAHGQTVDLPWVRVAAGQFRMGCVPGDTECLDSERPQHEVTLARPFDLMATEVTLAQYARFLNATGYPPPPLPDYEQGGDHPVVNLTWTDAAAFCDWAGGRLPTEAEWEYAARAGHDDRIYWWGDEPSREWANIGAAECCEGATGGSDVWLHTAPVGSLPANDFGLHDMTGNVWEWVDAWIDEYPDQPVVDPRPAEAGFLKVMRGASWLNFPMVTRLSVRLPFAPDGRTSNVGARCARDVSDLRASEESGHAPSPDAYFVRNGSRAATQIL